MQAQTVKEIRSDKNGGKQRAKTTNGNGEPAQAESKTVVISIPKANMQILPLLIEGTSPYVQNRFWNKGAMMEQQAAGSTAQSKKKREPKNFEKLYQNAMYRPTDGGFGMPASSFRNACVSACRLVGFKMTHAKLAVFVQADAYDEEGTPLVRIIKGKPKMHVGPARNANGSIDLRARPMWAPGWQAKVLVEFDADVFTPTDVANLFDRVGKQVGVGEGRHDSRESCGLGWGTFRIVS